jgi:ApaG protein
MNYMTDTMYQKTTNAITISVSTMYLDDQSSPEEEHHVWAYHIRIHNNGAEPVKLHNRHWRITDSFGRTQEVHGLGVVGEQPVIPPGCVFEYTSGTPLDAPSGIMMGSYGMLDAQGTAFDIEIPPFSLDSPYHPMSIQ